MDQERGRPASTGNLEPFGGGSSFRPFGVLALFGMMYGIIGGLGAAALGTLAVSLVTAIMGTVAGLTAGWIVGSFLKGERRGEAPLIGAGVGAVIQAGWTDPAAAVQAGTLGGVVGGIAGPAFLLTCFGLGYIVLRKTGPPRHPFDG